VPQLEDELPAPEIVGVPHGVGGPVRLPRSLGHGSGQPAGRMFWFIRKRLVGSYAAFSLASRS
jgi:hypothetical protein